jgi:hypothetical protein
MFFCGPFGCSLTPSTRRSSFGLEIYSDPRLFAAIKLRPEPVHPLFLFFGFCGMLKRCSQSQKSGHPLNTRLLILKEVV